MGDLSSQLANRLKSYRAKEMPILGYVLAEKDSQIGKNGNQSKILHCQKIVNKDNLFS